MKKSFSKKSLALLIAIAVILSSFMTGFVVNAETTDIDVWDGTIATGYASGEGTIDDPYIIETPEQLALMAIGTTYNEGKNIKDKYYKLTTDIYLNDTTNANWKDNIPTPWLIGKSDSALFFTGNLDGDGHTIRGLYASGNFERMGLFPGVHGNVSIKKFAKGTLKV